MSAMTTISSVGPSEVSVHAAHRLRQDTFVSLLEGIEPSIRRTAREITRNPADAEDVQQTAVMRAYEHLGEFKGRLAAPQPLFRAWVIRIAANEAIDTVRRRRPGRVVSLDEPGAFGGETGLLSSVTAASDNPEQQYARLELRRRVAEAIEQLDPRVRRVCLLRDVAQLSTNETAERLGIPPATVRVRLFRARLALRKRLCHLFERPPRRRQNTSLAPCVSVSRVCGD
jgi:RNA polymerase sigma-70 factor (ECF subfamily)